MGGASTVPPASTCQPTPTSRGAASALGVHGGAACLSTGSRWAHSVSTHLLYSHVLVISLPVAETPAPSGSLRRGLAHFMGDRKSVV